MHRRAILDKKGEHMNRSSQPLLTEWPIPFSFKNLLSLEDFVSCFREKKEKNSVNYEYKFDEKNK